MRRVAAALAALCLSAAGCGDSAGGEPESARYLDPRSDLVLTVDLDYDGGNWEQLKRLYERATDTPEPGARFEPRTLDGVLEDWASELGLSFADDVRPLLGGALHVGVRVEPAEPLLPGVRRHQPSVVLTAVYEVEDREALARVLEKLSGVRTRPIPGVEDARMLGDFAAVAGDDTIVAVLPLQDDEDEDADRLLRERLASPSGGPALPELGDHFTAARASPSLLGAWLDREELARALGTAAGRALRGAEATVRLDEDAARAEAHVDFEGLSGDELPLPEAGDLSLPEGEGVASASADQSRTTVFLSRLVRELYPESRFVRRVEALERQLGVSFEDEVLRQFAGPSISIFRPEGPNDTWFAARSTLRDPDAMGALLPRLAPALPPILEALEGLGSTGLFSLLLVAPDAPLTPEFVAQLAAIEVSRIASGPDEQLYEARGLYTRGLPDSVVYGIVDDSFVVASTDELAREVAALPTEEAPDAATRLRVDPARVLEQAGAEVGEDSDERVLSELVERLELSASAGDGDVVADAEAVWAR